MKTLFPRSFLLAFSHTKLMLVAAAAWLAFIPHASALITSSTYPFSTQPGIALENMSSGTTQLVAANLDDNASAVTDIGFDFWFDGVRHTQFSVNANGICRLGPSGVDTQWDNSSNFASANNAPKICPYYDDLWIGTNGKVHYKVIGSAPNRKLVVEWLNMQIPRLGGGNNGAGTFQMWLSETTGNIEFVFGSGMVLNSANGGYSIGLQSGAATNFGSVTSTTSSVSYAAANTTQTNAIASGTQYKFATVVPAAPSGLSFTSIGGDAMTLNWTDNSSIEAGYVIYRSLDNTNFSFATQTAPNATSSIVTGLTPNTNYFWRVYAVSTGALSPVLAGSQATGAPNEITSVGGIGHSWSDPGAWVGGVVPTATDNVTIASFAGVEIDTNAFAYNLTISNGAVLSFEVTAARQLTVTRSVTIQPNGTFKSGSGNNLQHGLTVGSHLTNQGTLNFGNNSSNAPPRITSAGPGNAIFSGTASSITNVHTLTINRGNDPGSSLALNFSANFTVDGSTSDDNGFVTLLNGTLRIAGTFSMTNRVFVTNGAYTIPSTAGIQLENPNFVVAATASGTTTINNGLLEVDAGTYNVGLSAADGMDGGNGAHFGITGGTLNFAGRFDPQNAVGYFQAGGTVNVATVGNTRVNYGSFELYSTASTFEMRGGTINLINPSTSATVPIDYRVRSGTSILNNDSGTPTLVVGGPGSPASANYDVSGVVPRLQINPGKTMRVTLPVLVRGTNVVNNGAITCGAPLLTTAIASESFTFDVPHFNFAGPAAIAYSGTGTFGTAAAPFGGGGVGCDTIVTLESPIITNRVNLFGGFLINSNQITLGRGGSLSTFVQAGSPGSSTGGGSFDVAPNHNQGTGGQSLLYSDDLPRTMGFELNPTRNLTTLTIDSIENVTLDGNVALNAVSSTALRLTKGQFVTGSYTLSIVNDSATTERTAGYVVGNLRKNYANPGSKTFEVGDFSLSNSAYTPVTYSLSSEVTGNVTVRVDKAQHPNYPPLYPNFRSGLQRYWTITAPASMNGNLAFQYLQADIAPGENRTNYVLAQYRNGAFHGSPEFVTDYDDLTNTAFAFDLPNIAGTWTLVEDADFDGMTTTYELAHNLNPNSAADANTDADGDGQTNLSEYFAGTDPQDRNSALRILSTARNGSGFFQMTLNKVANKTYGLEYKDTLSQANWTPLFTLSSTAGLTLITDNTVNGSQTQRFYRVRLLQP